MLKWVPVFFILSQLVFKRLVYCVLSASKLL